MLSAAQHRCSHLFRLQVVVALARYCQILIVIAFNHLFRFSSYPFSNHFHNSTKCAPDLEV